MESPTYGQPNATRTAQLDRLATALSAYPDITATVGQAEGAPCLAVANPAAAGLPSETVAIGRIGEDSGYVTWDWHPATGDDTAPRQPADIASTLLTGQSPANQPQGDCNEQPKLTLKGAVGRELTAQGLTVNLKIYPDEMAFNAHTGIVITTPRSPDAAVRITDDGFLSWERDYWPETAEISWEPDPTSHITDPPALAADIVTTVTHAIAVAMPALAGPR